MQKIDIPLAAKNIFAYEHFNRHKKNLLLCFSDEENAFSAYKQLMFLEGSGDESDSILYLPSLDTTPYDRVSPSANILMQRTNILTQLSQNKSPKLILTNASNLLNKLPPPSVFINSNINLTAGMKMDIEEVTKFLISNNFNRCASAVDSGEFAIRGEIIDIVTYESHGYRINFGWENIESIREYDTYSQISQRKIESLSLSSASETLLNDKTIINFKNNFLKLFGVNHINNPLYTSIIEGQKFHGYEHLTPLFYEKMSSIYDFLGDHEIIYDHLCIQSILEYETSYNEFYQSRLLSNKANPDSFYFSIPVDNLIYNSQNTKDVLVQDNAILLQPGQSDNFLPISNIGVAAKIEHKTEFDKLLEITQENKSKIPVIFCNSKIGRERIKNIADSQDIWAKEVDKLSDIVKRFINLAIAPLSHSFTTNKHLFIAEQDIFGSKFSTQTHKSSKRKLKNILTELDNISENEYIVHKDHGIGIFERIQTLYIKEIPHDCLKIIYADNDILYLPVENIDQIKKYGNDSAILDKLGGANWQRKKAKLKNRIKDIAASLIKLTAERQLTKTPILEYDSQAYQKFCDNFPYNETEDQISAIKDIQDDLQNGHIMDRLICGDVGFGKTEVAMRAAFMATHDIKEDSPQIAIITPTTILCKQHYTSFIERFKNMNLNIAQLSRLVTPTISKRIREDLANGKINIIIGTHTLLAPGTKFKNLKMIIIDEEQHFGVSQKERLKQIKTNVHVLSLSATPIPRTLQMSMVGIKDLSLIATPPIDRLPVRTNVMPFDPVVIRDALMRERFRGGLSFYVVPRIKDMEWVEKQLKKMVPELKFAVAHGQMTPSKVDTIMSDFCEGKFDILLSTTIIESGIDIPIANTIIIHRADMLGLSQLYQLRGRVGRSKVRGYAYLTLASNKKTTDHSLQRLDILQNIDSLGAGFTIASHDMDLRGFGNLVGSEQSGHIKEVGSELYQEMLDEAIASLNAEKSKEKIAQFTPNINLDIPVLIPFTYIEDSSLRLAIYRRAADLQNLEEIDSFINEMIDRFGPIPEEFMNLLNVVKIKNICLDLKIENLDSGAKGFVIKFNENFDVSEMVFSFLKKHPRTAKMRPDNKLIFMKILKNENLLLDTENLLKELSTHR